MYTCHEHNEIKHCWCVLIRKKKKTEQSKTTRQSYLGNIGIFQFTPRTKLFGLQSHVFLGLWVKWRILDHAVHEYPQVVLDLKDKGQEYINNTVTLIYTCICNTIRHAVLYQASDNAGWIKHPKYYHHGNEPKDKPEMAWPERCLFLIYCQLPHQVS